MSRARKPLEQQKGRITSITAAKKKMEEESIIVGADQLATPPSWVTDKLAKSEWRRLTKELSKIDIIGNLDRNNLACYCESYARWVEATKHIGSEGVFVPDEKGIPRRNIWVGIQKQYADEMRKFAALCGMTIDSRLKAAAVKTAKKEEEIETKFGGI